MLDQEFLEQFEDCTLPKEELKHIGHLRICWLYLSKYPYPEAAAKITAGILRYAMSLGAEHIYNETLTQVWIRLVANCMEGAKGVDFDTFLERNPQLLNKKLPNEYYSEDLLFSDLAKKCWVEPDIKPLEAP